MEKLKDKILEEYKKGNIVVSGFEGLMVYNIDDIIKQPVDGLLYDLNRGEETILTFIDDPKWVNDYASSQVIRKMAERISLLESINEELEKQILENNE